MVSTSSPPFILISNVAYATSYLQKTLGLLNSVEPKALYFQTRWGIHTFGMKFPIDVVIFDDTHTVKAIKSDVRPGQFFFWNPLFNNVLELPKGTIKKKNILVGLKIKIV